MLNSEGNVRAEGPPVKVLRIPDLPGGTVRRGCTGRVARRPDR